MPAYDPYNYDDPWAEVRHTREAIRARADLLCYTLAISAPFVALIAVAAYLCGLEAHEITGVTCYNAMVTCIFFFDTIRNASHACFDEAMAESLVTYREGVPVIDAAYPHRRLAGLSFAIGGRIRQE